MTISAEAFKKLCGRWTTGVTIVTARSGDTEAVVDTLGRTDCIENPVEPAGVDRFALDRFVPLRARLLHRRVTRADTAHHDIRAELERHLLLNRMPS